MALLGILAALVVIGIPVGVIVALVKISGLSDRVARLERRLAQAEEAADRLTVQPMAAAPGDTADAPPPVAAPLAADDLPSPWAPAAAATTEPAIERAPPPAPAPAIPRRSPLGDWMRENWVFAVAALSLALAGVFFVQYGMENGLLPPAARVIGAILFGLALIAGGEFVRRRSGDGARSGTAHIPSTLSGAGIVSMFAGVLAARQLYGLIDTGPAFVGLVAVAALAVVLGWFYGPFLAAVGLIGAGLAPFAVGGGSDDATPLYGYFTLIAGAGLAVDTIRRWAWVSVLALAVGYGGLWVLLMATGGAGWFGLALVGLALLALLVPCLKLAPDHQGPMLAEFFLSRGTGDRPLFPTWLGAGAVAVSSAGLLLLPAGVAAESGIAFLGLALLTAALVWWSAGARALQDIALLPALAFLARLVFEGADLWPLAADYANRAAALRPAEVAAPMTAAALLALASVLTLLAAWRSGGPEYRPHWAAAAALIAPLSAVALELFWAPSSVIGAYPWALHVMALAGLMAFLAVRFARADGEDRRRAAYAVLATLSLIALALFLIATKAALTVAIGALIVVAATLDRRFRLPEMGLFIQAAVIGLSYRLIIDPGVTWAVDDAALWEVVLSFGGAVAASVAGLWTLRGMERRGAQVFLESGGATAAALCANVLITRWLTADYREEWLLSHWSATLNALPWLVLALSQLYRLSLGGFMRWVRGGIAALAGLFAAVGIGAAALPLDPLFGLLGTRSNAVYGPTLFDTLAVAYALPALVILLALTRLGHLPRWLRLGLTGAGAALAALYVGLEIRRFWRGDDLSVPGVTQAELYSYTVALMLLGAGLLYQALARNSAGLRRAAMAVIGLTVAKVFLLDASGLSGLTRVFSFLALGLSLIALAWLNRWVATRVADKPPQGQ